MRNYIENFYAVIQDGTLNSLRTYSRSVLNVPDVIIVGRYLVLLDRIYLSDAGLYLCFTGRTPSIIIQFKM